jgi:hypothetical protein
LSGFVDQDDGVLVNDGGNPRLFSRINGLTLGGLDVVGVRTTHVAGRGVVADSVPGAQSRHGARGAEVAVAANLLSLPPDELREVTPLLEVRHVGAVLAIVAGGEEIQLAVVPAVAGRASDGRGGAKGFGILARAPHGKVLTVATAANIGVVLKDASLGQGLGVTSNLIAPLEGAGGMVEAVNVVVVDGGARVVGGFCGLILGRRRGGRGLRVRRGLSGLGLFDDRRRLGRRLGGRLRFGRRGGLGSGFDDGFGGRSRRRGRGRRRGSGRRFRRGCGRSGLGRPGARAAEGGGSIAVSHRDGDPFSNDICLDVKLAALEDGAGDGQDGAASGEEDRGLHRDGCCAKWIRFL